MGKKATKMRGVTSITRNGAAYWYAHVDGRRVYCGKGEQGRKLAEAARAKHVAKQYEHREVSAGLETKRAEFSSIRALSNWYMTLPSTQALKSYDCRIDQAAHLLEHMGRLPVGKADPDRQERYREDRKAEGAADGTIDNEIALLSIMFHLAVKRRKIPAEMMPGQFILHRKTNPRRLITEEEYSKLLDSASDDDFRDFMLCAWESGMRESEIIGLRAGQVHLDEERLSGGGRVVVDYIDLGIFDTKNQTRRTVPVSAELKYVLQRRLEGLGPDGHVFTCKGKPYKRINVLIRMRTACNRAGIVYGDKPLNGKGERTGIVFHCFRHSRTTRWVEAGFSDEIIRRATGHKSLEAYRTYVKLDPTAVVRLVSGGLHKTGIKRPRIRAIGG